MEVSCGGGKGLIVLHQETEAGTKDAFKLSVTGSGRRVEVEWVGGAVDAEAGYVSTNSKLLRKCGELHARIKGIGVEGGGGEGSGGTGGGAREERRRGDAGYVEAGIGVVLGVEEEREAEGRERKRCRGAAAVWSAELPASVCEGAGACAESCKG